MDQKMKPGGQKHVPKYRKKVIENTLYARSLITRRISLLITNIGSNLQDNIEKFIALHYEGKCIVEGYVKPDSCKIITYSSGQVKGNNIDFEVVFECFICCPIEGMLIQTVAKNITKAGIRGESVGENPSPVIIFITRDHHYMNAYFSTIEEGDTFVCRIIGQRFELNDKYVSIIAELVEPKKDLEPTTFKPKLVFEE